MAWMTSQTMLFTDMVTAVEAQARAISVTAMLKATTPASEPPYSRLDIDAHQTQLAQFPEVLQEGGPVFLLIHFRGDGLQFALGKVSCRVLNHFLVFR